MKSSTAQASAVLVMTANASLVANAFVTPSSSSLTQRPIQAASTTTSSRLSLLPDPTLANSAVESSSVMTSSVLESLGSLALFGSIGLGMAFSNTKNSGKWKYEYKAGNELSEAASKAPVAVLEKVRPQTLEIALKSSFGDCPCCRFLNLFYPNLCSLDIRL